MRQTNSDLRRVSICISRIRVKAGDEITSFTASPMPGGYAVLQPNGTDVITFSWTQSGFARVGMQINGNLFWGNYTAGAYTDDWNGSVEGSYLLPGYYVAHIWAVCGGITTDEATINVQILP